MSRENVKPGVESPDKAGKAYWDQVWTIRDLPSAVDPNNRSLRAYMEWSLHRYFLSVLGDLKSPPPDRPVRFLEIGCARSSWLPYFAKEFGFTVTGLDYSEVGCEQSRQILANEGVKGEVVHTDFFSPPPEMIGQFDVVLSVGVVEHFEDTAVTLAAFARFLKPGGRMVTNIPNLVGAIGWVQKKINRDVYDIHVPMGRERLADAHRKAGLDVKECRYYMSTNFFVNNLEGLDPALPGTKGKRLLLKALGRFSALAWVLEKGGVKFPTSRFLSPYVFCLSTKSKAP